MFNQESPITTANDRPTNTCPTNTSPKRKRGTQTMRKLFAILSIASLSHTAFAQDYFVEAVPEGFTAVFDGKTLNGWHGQPQLKPDEVAAATDEEKAKWQKEAMAHWTASDNAIVNDGDGPYLTTDKSYKDFELYLQYNTVALADSGIYLRGIPQVQIWDWTNKEVIPLGADKGSGGLWNNAPGAKGKDPLVKADNPLGEWNQFRIRLIGERCWIWLNGKLVVDDARLANYFDRAKPLPLTGPIQFQTHGGKISWRHVYMKELSAEDSNAILFDADLKNAKYLFNGRELAGWAGATDSYESVIRCRDGMGGTLHSMDEYKDFDMFVEFRLPEAGNNGLVMRYPLDQPDADGAYSSMCELQILDDAHEDYANIDPRQAHGSAYGMIPAERGYLRPTGEWNYQKVSVRGSKIEVELNGTRILDGDLATVKEFMADSPHPGKDRTSGAVGLAGHTDPVEFRMIAVEAK
jgi:hypothetical protein